MCIRDSADEKNLNELTIQVFGWKEKFKKILSEIFIAIENYELEIVKISFSSDGFLTVQEKDLKTDSIVDMKTATKTTPSDMQLTDLVFASKICKHTKSNTIVFAKNKQLFASGVGQTSRVDALKQAVKKANSFKLDLNESVMALSLIHI